jgi:hypothetical protein
MSLRAPDENHRYRGFSISFDPAEARWIDGLVDLLRQEGFPRAARSEVVRLAVLGLRDALAGRTRSEIVQFLLQRDADRNAAANNDSPILPFDLKDRQSR